MTPSGPQAHGRPCAQWPPIRLGTPKARSPLVDALQRDYEAASRGSVPQVACVYDPQRLLSWKRPAREVRAGGEANGVPLVDRVDRESVKPRRILAMKAIVIVWGVLGVLLLVALVLADPLRKRGQR